jgi:hypothetical protein
MKLAKEISRILFMIAIAFAIYRDDWRKVIQFSLLFIFAIYVYPVIVIFICKLFRVKKSLIGYDGEIVIREPSGEENGKVSFKIKTPIEELHKKDDILLLIRNEE